MTTRSVLGSLDLSRQEERVLILTMSGHGDKEVGARLGVGVGTVRTYWNRIREKTGGQTRAEIISMLVQRGARETIEAKNSENELLVSEIAKRKKAEQTFRAIADASPHGIFLTDRKGHTVYVNAATERIVGIESDDAMGCGWASTIHPDDKERVFNNWYRYVATGGNFRSEHRRVRGGGEVVWTQTRATELTVDEEVIGYVGIVEDVTERHEHEEQVRAKDAEIVRLQSALTLEKAMREAVFSASCCLILVLDKAGRVVGFNRACELASGYTERELVGQPIWDLLVAVPDRNASIKAFHSLVAGGPANGSRTHWTGKNGSTHLVEWLNSPVCDAEGRFLYSVSTGTQVPEEPRALKKNGKLAIQLRVCA